MFMNFRFIGYCFKLSKIIAVKFTVFMIFALFSLCSGVFSLIDYCSKQKVTLFLIFFIVSIIIAIISVFSVISDLRVMTGAHLVKKCMIFRDLQELKSMSCTKSKYKFSRENLKNGTIFYSWELNKLLIKKVEIRAKITKSKYKNVRKEISHNREQYLPFLAKQITLCNSNGVKFTDDAKLCLSSDINDKCVSFHYGTYYDTFLTNIICGSKMIKNDECSVLQTAINFPKDSKGNLKSISSSGMNDEIGVSTIAFTSDNYMFFYKQNYRTNSSNGLIAPSGSGSADKGDYCAGSFRESIIKGMQRELLEETGLIKFKKEISMDTNIIGYFRWGEKGGKPEFIGITKFNNISRYEIGNQKSEVCDISDYYVLTISDLKVIAQRLEMDPSASVPLAAAMYFILEHICRENPKGDTPIKEFFSL